jgi:hypothetical protein
MPIQEVIRRLYVVLLQYGTVSVKDTGTFSLHTSHAEFIESGTLLTPPNTTILFSRIVDPGCSFSSLLVESGVQTDIAFFAEEELARQCSPSLNADSPISFQSFGTLYQKSFEPIDAHFFNKYFGLQAVEVPVFEHSVPRPEITQSKLPTTSLPTQKEGMSGWLFWSIIAVILLLVGGAIWLMPHIPSSVTIRIPAPKPTEASTEQNMGDDSTFLNQNPAPAHPGASNGQARTQDQCTIIVGAFRLPDNAEKMKQRIAAAGYRFFEQDVQGFKRVGVVMSCDPGHPESVRDTARRQFHPEAWFLRDN